MFVGKVADDLGLGVAVGGRAHTECPGDGRRHEAAVVQHGEVHEPHPVGPGVEQTKSVLGCQPGLADTPGADQRGGLRRLRHLGESLQIGVAPEDRGVRSAQVVAISGQHPKSRKRVGESVAAQLRKLDRVVEVTGRETCRVTATRAPVAAGLHS